MRHDLRGVVAAGNHHTALAAVEILRAGGNAFDAALAAMLVTGVSEPVLASLGGGGFMLAEPVGAAPELYDFFGQTPARPLSADDVDFRPSHVDFGTVRQTFHIGLGSIATPGMPAALFDIHARLGRAPLQTIIEPACHAARTGVVVDAAQAYVLNAVSPIMLATPEARAVYESPTVAGRALQEGERLAIPALADTLEHLVRGGPREFYEGDIGQTLLAWMRDGRGALEAEDLAAYRVLHRRPLERTLGRTHLATNPAPSSGGPLIAFCLELLHSQRDQASDPTTWAPVVAEAMDLTNRARAEAGLAEQSDDARVAALLDAPFMARWRAALAGRAEKIGGTTHLSVVDAAGNACAMSLSNGEGCGHVHPALGFMPNNFLGEADLHPRGFFGFDPATRITSMMAPTVLRTADGWRLAIGSGGSNRIRTAMVQVIANFLWRGMSLAEAVAEPRLHQEGPHLDIEGEFDPAAADALAGHHPDHRRWPDMNFFFGGVHAAAHADDGRFDGAGDPRRGGVVMEV